ncbi:MAG: DUF4199 domain-containing protein [Rikenellaceae bacterium]|nr:DUF4199 domain-containing protein [Rikenellaceae bacterium]MBQ7342224.1 DUF4199 domain-containing protein [Alistipes sp.]
MEREFWNDVASKGAILGVLMLASNIFEQAMFLNGTMGRLSFVGIEAIVVFVIYVFLLFYFAKRHSLQYSKEEGFSYGKAFGYVLTLSLFTSVIVGLGSYIFTHFIIGYKEYVDGVLNLYTNIFSTIEVPAQMANTYEQLIDQIGSQPEPSLFAIIFASIRNYLLLGGFVGLIIAAVVKREPNIFGDELE